MRRPVPNIRSQRVSKDELYIQASDGREYTITRAGVLAIYGAQTGNAAARKQKTIDAIKAAMVAALGAEQVDALLCDIDFDPADSNKAMLLTLRSL